MLRKKFNTHFQYQVESSDCAAACLTMIVRGFNKPCTLDQIKTLFEFTRVGVSIQDILDVSEKLGLESSALKLSLDDLLEIPKPLILYWKQDHFVVLQKIKFKNNIPYFYIGDPGYGEIVIDAETLQSEWNGDNDKGVVIYFEEGEEFQNLQLPKVEKESYFDNKYFQETFFFLKKHKVKYAISFGLILLSLLANFFIPFVFQKTIDLGVVPKSITIVYYFLLAQFVLFMSGFIFEFGNNIILTRLNFNLSIRMKEFLMKKLIKLPINFFDTRLNTETLQRLSDQDRIQTFLTWKGIDFVLSFINILVFGLILLYFNKFIFFVYFIFSLLSVLWIAFFLKRRAMIEYGMFIKQSQNNNNIYEFIMNMPEIKINNAQNKVIGKILTIQDKLNKLSLNSLFLNMYQLFGMNFFTKLKELAAFGICAILIINGELTLGSLLSISYIIGQLNTPIQKMLFLIRDTQDADISNKRVSEIYSKEEEDLQATQHVDQIQIEQIEVKDLKFKYPGKFSPYVLDDVSFTITANSTTAIVGSSGSGKSTLLKLLLNFYMIEHGTIKLNDININDIYSNEWRRKCGIVMQDGNIFSGTILDNIVFSDIEVDEERVVNAAQMACIYDFILTLPMGFNTKVGTSGIELSGGQKQRILIARAVYKDPEYIFFDEATSALDAENEKNIHDNLQEFFKGKTVIIIAHRLSTVKNADQIIVLKNGKIVEQGGHLELVENKSNYYSLVKNQLELGG